MHVMLALDQSRYAEAVLKWVKAFSFPVGKGSCSRRMVARCQDCCSSSDPLS